MHYSSFKNLKTTFEKSTFWNTAGLLSNKNKEQTVLTKTEKKNPFDTADVESNINIVKSNQFLELYSRFASQNDVTKSMS